VPAAFASGIINSLSHARRDPADGLLFLKTGPTLADRSENLARAGQFFRLRPKTCHIRFFLLLPLATSRVELTLNANLLPSKVASSQGEMRPIRQQTG
jgi:hypothetical protein